MATLHGERLLLLIDSDETRGHFVASMLGCAGWKVQRAATVSQALATMAGTVGVLLDAVLVEAALPQTELASGVRALRDWHPGIPVLIHGADAQDIAGLLHALTAGVNDLVAAPLTAERLDRALTTAIAAAEQGHTSDPALSLDWMQAQGLDDLVARSTAMQKTIGAARKAARTRAPVVIEGDAGTGRSLLAAAIHLDAAGTRAQPAVRFDCAHHAGAMIAPLIFGFEQGAFAGAFERRTGVLAQADGGTLIIANAHRLPADAQARLAEWLRSGWLTPFGGAQPQRAEVRLIACTATNLRTLAARHAMRDDLAARMSVVESGVPPLRDRRDDIADLAREALTELHAAVPSAPRSFTTDAIEALMAHDWPGNVAQLRSVIARAAATNPGPALSADHLRCGSATAKIGAPIPSPKRMETVPAIAIYNADGHLRPLDAIEADIIRLAISHYRGRMSEVARRLGIGRSTLYRKLSEIGNDDAAA